MPLPSIADKPAADQKLKPSTTTTKGGSEATSKSSAATKASGSATVKSKTKDTPARKIDGAAVFKQYCASCHAQGGNRVTPSRPVAESKKVANIGIFKEYLSAPPGHMPYYQQVVKDKKTLEALFKYCNGLKRQPIKQAFDATQINIR